MDYTFLTLTIFGLSGVLLHNLVALNKLNKKAQGNLNLSQYFKLEIFSILISIIVVLLAVFVSQEIEILYKVGNMLGLAFVSIGYMGQSLLVTFIGKASKMFK